MDLQEIALNMLKQSAEYLKGVSAEPSDHVRLHEVASESTDEMGGLYLFGQQEKNN